MLRDHVKWYSPFMNPEQRPELHNCFKMKHLKWCTSERMVYCADRDVPSLSCKYMKSRCLQAPPKGGVSREWGRFG